MGDILKSGSYPLKRGLISKFSWRHCSYSSRQDEFSSRQGEFPSRQDEFSPRQDEFPSRQDEFSPRQDEYPSRHHSYSSKREDHLFEFKETTEESDLYRLLGAVI
jgi:hypothetical protein